MNRIAIRAARWSVLALLFALLPAGTTACGEEESYLCTAMGCVSGAKFAVPLVQSLETIQASTLEVCLNDRCISGELTGISAPGDDVNGQVVSLAGSSAYPSLLVSLEGASEGYQIVMDYQINSKDELTDGDRYRFKLVDGTGQVRFDVERTATYTALSPNGPKCDGEAGLCLVASWER